MSDGIRQFQTKEERANEELRRIIGPPQHLELRSAWEELDRLAAELSQEAKDTQEVIMTGIPKMEGKDWFITTLNPRRKFMNSDFQSVADWDKGLY